jgi:peptidoglycan/xylan/chitin deacetylase (PgdA/CDA1 family)
MNTLPGQFEKHVKWLRSQGAVFCTLSELVNRMKTHDTDERLVALTFDDGFADILEFAFPIVQACGAKMTVFLIAENGDAPFLTPAQIRAMQQSGCVEFGSHTLTHADLFRIDDEAARREIADSKQAVERLSGAPCASFAYPFGHFLAKHTRMVHDAGFTAAVSIKRTLSPWPQIDPFAIPRLSVDGRMNLLQFRLVVTRERYRL